MRDPYIDVSREDESAHVFTCALSLLVLASTWRLRTSYSSLVEFTEASVIEEVYGSFLGLDTSWNELSIWKFSLNAGSQCWL